MGTWSRRAVSIPGVALAALALLVLLPVWVPIAVAADLVRLRRRLPLARLLAFALGWAWLETIAIGVTALAWCAGQRGNRRLHYDLQRWWAMQLMTILRSTTGLRIEAEHWEVLTPGPTIVLCRHASLADSLVSAWVITSLAHQRPRYVLKRELLFDPCLDIVGNRLPNHFLDRGAADSSRELAQLTALAADLGPDDAAVIFPEGTRATPAKRTKALQRIAARDPERAERLASLRHLLPPRPAGTAALFAGAPDADVVLAWHVGFDGLDTFGGILRHLARTPPPVRFVTRRVSREDVPSGDALTRWLDDEWLRSDAAVDAALTSTSTSTSPSPSSHTNPSSHTSTATPTRTSPELTT